MKSFLLLIISLICFSAQENLFAKDFSYSNSRNHFIKNNGQLLLPDGTCANSVLFYKDQPGSKTFICTWGISYFILKPASAAIFESTYSSNSKNYFFTWERIDVLFENGSISNIDDEKSIAEPIQLNYCIGNRSINTKGYAMLLFKNIYPGIDWQLQSSGEKMGYKQNFIVHDGANINMLKMRLVLPENCTAKFESTQFEIETKFGSIRESGLTAFTSASHKKINTQYTSKENQFGFTMQKYFGNEDIIIDPNVIVWSSYYGGAGDDYGASITAVNGKVWATGYTSSMNLPVVNPGSGAFYQGSVIANFDAYILRFNSTTVALELATYFGGNGNDYTSCVASDGIDIFIVGCTSSSNFPVSNPGGLTYFDGVLDGSTDGFIIKLNAAGLLLWSTYYGGANADSISSVACTANNVWVTGITLSSNLQTTNAGGGAYYQSTYGGLQDAFFLKLASSGELTHATYYGGNDIEQSNSITANGNNVYFTGYSASDNFPLLNPGGGAYFQGTHDGIDIFIVKLNASAVRSWSTFYGGNDDEESHCIYCDGNKVWITGYAVSGNFPRYNPGGTAYYQNTKAGADETSIILKFDLNGVREWATFYGGNVNSRGYSIFSVANAMWLVGYSESSNLPVQNPGGGAFFQAHNSNLPNVISESWDLMLLEFTADGTRQWATYYGDVEDDFGHSIYFDSTYLWIIGSTQSDVGLTLVNPGGGAYFQNTCGCGGLPVKHEALIIKFGVAPNPLPLQLVSFNAKAYSNYNKVIWTVNDECEVDKYVVLKSVDGKNFYDIDEKKAQHFFGKVDYCVDDYEISATTNYYELKIVSKNGDIKSSNILTLKRSNTIAAEAVANNEQSQIEIILSPQLESPLKATIYDITGKEVAIRINITENININTSGWNKGIYFIKMEGESTRVVEKLFIQ